MLCLLPNCNLKSYQPIAWKPNENTDTNQNGRPMKHAQWTETVPESIKKAVPHLVKKQSRWYDDRSRSITEQLPTLNIVLDRLHQFLASVQERLNDNEIQHATFHHTIKAKLEKSLIGFFEAQAFTRALLRVEAGEESDVERLYEWWETLWKSVPFEYVYFVRNPDTTFPILLTKSLTPSQLLSEFLKIDGNGRYQNMCASWMVTHWIETSFRKWSYLLTEEMERVPTFRPSPQFNVKSQRLHRRLIDIGLSPHEDRRKNKIYYEVDARVQ